MKHLTKKENIDETVEKIDETNSITSLINLCKLTYHKLQSPRFQKEK